MLTHKQLDPDQLFSSLCQRRASSHCFPTSGTSLTYHLPQNANFQLKELQSMFYSKSVFISHQGFFFTPIFNFNVWYVHRCFKIFKIAFKPSPPPPSCKNNSLQLLHDIITGAGTICSKGPKSSLNLNYVPSRTRFLTTSPVIRIFSVL